MKCAALSSSGCSGVGSSCASRAGAFTASRAGTQLTVFQAPPASTSTLPLVLLVPFTSRTSALLWGDAGVLGAAVRLGPGTAQAHACTCRSGLQQMPVGASSCTTVYHHDQQDLRGPPRVHARASHLPSPWAYARRRAAARRCRPCRRAARAQYAMKPS